MLPGFALGKPPPPGDPGWGELLGVRPGAGFAAISTAAVARTVVAIPGNVNGGFHLYLLVFPFVYQFYSIIEALVSSSFANDKFRRISVSFQHHFKI